MTVYHADFPVWSLEIYFIHVDLFLHNLMFAPLSLNPLLLPVLGMKMWEADFGTMALFG